MARGRSDLRRALGVSLGAVGLALVGLQTPWGADALSLAVHRIVGGLLADGYTLDPLRVRWGLGGRVTAQHVVIRGPDRQPDLSVERADLALDLGGLLWGTVRVSRARIDGVRVAMDHDDEGVMNLVRAFGGPSDAPPDPDAEPWGGLPFRLEVEDLALRDGLVSLWGVPPDDGGDPGGFEAKVLALRGSVVMPRGTPEVRATDVHLAGELLVPGPTDVSLDGSVVWTGEGVLADHVRIAAGGVGLGLHGHARDLFGQGDVDVALDLDPLDLGLIDQLFGAGIAGRYEGRLTATGSLAALSLGGELRGLGDTRGRLAFQEGSMVCLPVAGAEDDACAGPIRPGGRPSSRPPTTGDLRWKAAIDIDGIHVEDIAPIVGGPLELSTTLEARGGGTTWPDGLWVADGRLTGGPLDVYSVPIRSFDLRPSLSDGVLSVGVQDITAVTGSVKGTFDLDFVEGDMRARATGRLQPEMLADLGVDQLGGDGTFTAKLDGNIYEDGVPLDITGTVEAAPLTWEGDAMIVRHLEADWAVHVEDGITDVAADGGLAGVFAYGARADVADIPRIAVHVDGEGVTVDGRFTAPEVGYSDGLASFEDVDATFSYRGLEDRPMAVDVEVGVGAHQLAGLLGTHGRIDVALRDSQLVVDTDLRWEDDIFVYAPAFQLDLDTMAAKLNAFVLQPTWRQRWTHAGPIRFRLVDGGLADADIGIRSRFGAIRVKGDLGMEGPLDGTVSVDQLDLDVLAELFPEQADGLDGELTLDLVARGDASRPEAELSIDASDLFLPGVVRWLDVEGTAEVADDVATLDLVAEVSDTPLARVVGTAPLHSDLSAPGLDVAGVADLRAVLDAGDLHRIELLVPELSLPVGRASGVVAVRGPLRDPDLDLEAVAEVAVTGLSDRLRVEADVARREGDLDAVVDLYRGLDPILLADGGAATRLGEITTWLLADGPEPDFGDLSLFADDLSVDARFDALPLPMLVDLLGVDLDLDGALDGDVVIAGDPARPTIEADLRADALFAGLPGELGLGVGPLEQGYGLEVRLGEGRETWLSVQGALPFEVDLEQPVSAWAVRDFDLSFGGDGIPVAVLRALDPQLEVERGVLRLGGTLGGSYDRPRPDVTLDLDEAAVLYRPLGIRGTDIGFTAHSEPMPSDQAGVLRLVLDELHADTRPISTSLERVAGGRNSRIEADGEVRLVGWRPEDIRGRISLDSAWLLATDRIDLRTSGRLQAEGSWPDVRFLGDLLVDHGRAELNTSELGAGGLRELDRAIVVHRTAGSTTRVEEADEGPPWWWPEISAQANLDLGRNVQTRLIVPVLEDLGSFGAAVTRADIEARLGGELSAEIRSGDVSVVGDVDLVDGRVSVLNSRFDVLSGSRISFLGRDYTNPALDVGGVMSVSGGDIQLRLTGTALDPELDLQSQAFGSDAEMLTVLLTGRSPDELSADQGAAAIEAVSDLLVSSVLGGLNLGSVSVEGDGSVTLGFPVARTLYVESTVDPTPQLNEDRITVHGEWSILPQLVLDAAYGDRHIYGDLYWEVTFDRLSDIVQDSRSARERLEARLEAAAAEEERLRREAEAEAEADGESGPDDGRDVPEEDEQASPEGEAAAREEDETGP